jgi:ABC-2 type transport system ATP-binding protein
LPWRLPLWQVRVPYWLAQPDRRPEVRIQITGLTKTYRGGTRAINGLDLTVPTGMFGLLGANGAGKTTLMRILAGLLRPTSGEVTVGPHDLTTAHGRTEVKRTLGYLPQDLGVYPDLTATEFLDYVALLKGMDDRAARRRRVAELLEVVALSTMAGRKLKGFSGGMKRRIGIAQALLNDPRLLIVDEPTAGLDPEERIRFRTLLARLAGDRTVLLSTHIVEDIAQTCRELAVLDKGQPIFRGTVADLMAVAQGRVWSVVTNGQEPEGVVVSALPDQEGVRYRVVAPTAPAPGAELVAPSLEDGYLALRGNQAGIPA